jgi:hypothetical protein
MKSIKSFFSKVFVSTEDFGKNLVTLIAKSGGPVLMQLATDAVHAAEATGGSGTDKFNAAKSSVILSLKTQGKDVVITSIEGAILMAVANMNANKPQS